MPSAFIALGILFFTGHALKWVFAHSKIPDLLFLILIGQILGPWTGWVHASQLGVVGRLLSELALVVILFEGGLGLDARLLKSSSWTAAKLTLLAFSLSALVGFLGTAVLSSLPTLMALYVGISVSSTSSAVVIPMLKFLAAGEKTKVVLTIESALNDILVIVLGLLILDSMKNPDLAIAPALLGLLPSTAASIGIGILAGVVTALAKGWFPAVTTIRFSTEAFVCIVYGIVGLAGLNGPLAVLAMGLIMGNLSLFPKSVRDSLGVAMRHRETELLAEAAFLLKVFFFIYLGMLIQWGSLQVILIASVVTAGIYVARYFVARLVLDSNGPSLDRTTVFAMGPRGLACAVVASLPLQRGIPEGEFIQSVVFCTIPLTIIVTSVVVMLAERKAAAEPPPAA